MWCLRREDGAELKVVVPPVIQQRMMEHAQSYPGYEVIGFLLGHIEGQTVKVKDTVTGEFVSQRTEASLTPEAMARIAQDLMDGKYEGKGKIVGWYHSHPGYGLFLSHTDIASTQMLQQFDQRVVAIVVEPNANEIGAFTVQNGAQLGIQMLDGSEPGVDFHARESSGQDPSGPYQGPGNQGYSLGTVIVIAAGVFVFAALATAGALVVAPKLLSSPAKQPGSKQQDRPQVTQSSVSTVRPPQVTSIKCGGVTKEFVSGQSAELECDTPFKISFMYDSLADGYELEVTITSDGRQIGTWTGAIDQKQIDLQGGDFGITDAQFGVYGAAGSKSYEISWRHLSGDGQVTIDVRDESAQTSTGGRQNSKDNVNGGATGSGTSQTSGQEGTR